MDNHLGYEKQIVRIMAEPAVGYKAKQVNGSNGWNQI